MMMRRKKMGRYACDSRIRFKGVAPIWLYTEAVVRSMV